MKIDRKNKVVIFGPGDNNKWQVMLAHPDFNEYINLKVTYTEKGFGIQAFSEKFYEDSSRRPLNIIVGERGDQVLYKEKYVAIWKLTPKFSKRITRAFKK